MTATVLLIRHAAHDRLDKVLCGRLTGVGLSEAGLAQAQRLGAALRDRGVDTVFHSPLTRARQTAEAIAWETGAPLCEAEDLNELDFGGWTGATFEALQGDPAWTLWNRQRLHSRPPQGETMLEAQVRAARFLETVRRGREGAVVAAVSHGDLIKATLAWALGLSLDFYARFEIGPASVSRLVLGDWGVKVWSVNQEAAP